MKTRQCYQVTAVLSYLGAFSLTTANPLPENSYGSDLDYVSIFNDDDLGSSDLNLNDASAWDPDRRGEMLAFDSTSNTDLSNMNQIDGTSIAYGDTLKAPYCGTTEQPVCCSDVVNFIGCRQFDPSDFVNCKGPNQACCSRIVWGVGERCYRGTPEWVDVKPSPGETPENVPEETPETAPQEPAFPTVEPIDWGELLRLWPLIPWPNLSPAGGAG